MRPNNRLTKLHFLGCKLQNLEKPMYKNPLQPVPGQVQEYTIIKISHSWTGPGNHYGHFQQP